MRRTLAAAYSLLNGRTGSPILERIKAQSELGHALMHLGRLDEAEPLGHNAAALAHDVLGPDHQVTLYTDECLATVYLQRGRLDEAESLLRRNLEDRRRASGPSTTTLSRRCTTWG